MSTEDEYSGLIDGLRDMSQFKHDDLSIGDEAADAITTLRAQLTASEASRKELREAVQAAQMALIGYLPGHRNAITDAAIGKCSAALANDAERKGGRCPYCDDTGDVHTPTGEWRGECSECKPDTQPSQRDEDESVEFGFVPGTQAEGGSQ